MRTSAPDGPTRWAPLDVAVERIRDVPTTTVIEELSLAMDEDLGLNKMDSDKPCSVDNIYKLPLLGPTTLPPQLIPTMSLGAVVKEDHLEAE
jgi:hypothetical protein